MDPQKIVVKFDQVAEQVQGPVKRIIGFVVAKHLLSLFDAADLEANPRSAKIGPVTDDIVESIEISPIIFPFKTKGVLIGASDYQSLQRQRYELRFQDTNVEGILDGGHNMLAIGTEILTRVIEDESGLRSIKRWDDLKQAWNSYRSEIEDVKDSLDFLVPIEILVPSDLEDDGIVDEFNGSLLDICAARNNNVQLTLETKANKRGFYAEIRNALPSAVANRVEWKTNDGGQIKVRDLIALLWIPLNKLREAGCLPGNIGVSPQNIYRNKGECTKTFDRLMDNPKVSKSTGGYEHELHNRSVHSAIEILGSIPALYDKIYADFPEAYNRSGGSFGRISVVKMFDPGRRGDKSSKYTRTQPQTHFFQKATKYRYPDGLIMPLVYGLKALMKVEAGTLGWIVDPNKFLSQHLLEIADAYKLVLEMSNFDPQKIGKNETSYKIALSEYEKALFKHGALVE